MTNLNALNIFPVLKKFSSGFVKRECIPKFRFEGQGIFSRDSKAGITAKWEAQNKSVGFSNIHQNSEENLSEWFVTADDSPHTKCLSSMFIRNVNLDILFNTMGKNFEIGLYKNEKLVKKIFDVPSNTTPFINSLILHPSLSLKLDFDQDYAWGFQTDDGSNPPYNDSNFLIEFTISCLVVMGGGDL